MPVQPPLGSIQCNNLFTPVDSDLGAGLRLACNKENDADFNSGRREIIFNRKRNNVVPPMNGSIALKSYSVVEAEDDALTINDINRNRRGTNVN